LRHFVNFSAKYHVKFGDFINFSYILPGKNVLTPKSTEQSELLRLYARTLTQIPRPRPAGRAGSMHVW